jgi:hypothetical protein
MARLRLESGSKVWPAQIQVCYSVRFRVRFCTQWRAFLSDNGLRKGDKLIVSLPATSEFVIYVLRKNLDRRCNSISTDTTSPSSSSHVPPKSKFRASPSDSFRPRPVTLGPENFKTPIKRHAEITDDSFNGEISFQKRMSEASTGHFGNPQFARVVRILPLSTSAIFSLTSKRLKRPMWPSASRWHFLILIALFSDGNTSS